MVTAKAPDTRRPPRVQLLLAAAALAAGAMLAEETHGQTIFLPGSVIQTIDTATGGYATIPQPAGANTRRVAVSNDQSLVYSGSSGNSIAVTNTATGEVVASIAGITPFYLSMSRDGTRLYATDTLTNALSVIDTATNAVISTTPLGFSLSDFAVTADGAHLYIPSPLGNSIAVFDTAAGTVTATITVANRPQAVAFSPDGTRAYVSSVGGDVSVINTATNTVVTTIAVGGQPAGLVVSPDGTRIYLTSQSNNKVYVIDTASNTVITTINVGAFPTGVAFSADGTRIYVTNFADRNVSVIDPATNSVIDTIRLGSYGLTPSVCANGNALLASGRTFTANSSSALSCTLEFGVNGPVFTGGTMRFGVTGISSSLPIDLQTAGGTFDTAGNNATLSGTVSGTGALTKTGDGVLTLSGTNTYSGGTIFNGGTLSVSSDANLGDVSGALSFNGGILRITGTTFTSTPRTINWGANGGGFDIADAANRFTVSQSLTGTGGLTKLGAGTLVLDGGNTYSGTTVVSAGTLAGGFLSLSANSAHTIATGATLDLAGNWQNIGSLSGAGTVTNSGGSDARLITGSDNSSATFAGVIKDGASRTEVMIDGTGITTFTGTNTYTGGTAICFCSTLQLGNGGTTGSIVGDVTNGGTLIFNRSNTYTFAGVISDDLTDAGKLVQAGTGNTILTGISSYTGTTTINAGTLSVNGSIASSSFTTVNAGGTLGGTGTIGNTLIAGGTLSPGNSIGTLTVQGNLAFTSAAQYMIEVSPTASDRTNVTGTATLAGAAVRASFAPGSYVAKKYTILNAAGGLGGSIFSSLVNTNLPESFKSSLSYDNNNVYLDLELIFVRPATAGTGGNQQKVGKALVNYFNSNGGIPLVYGGLTASGLTQASGETATGSQQTAFNAMTQFMGMMTDPFAAGRGDAAPAASSFDASDAMAYAPDRRSKAPRDAHAAIVKAMPPAPVFEPRWSMWASGFGGSQSTDGNAATGSNASSSRIYGAAAGADVWLSPVTLAGVSMAGGATTFSVAQGGSGQSDLMQVGGFIRHSIGTVYIAAAAAYGWQDITTERSVTVAGLDRLRARFNTNSYAGRIELGSRSTLTWLDGIGITPYAAAQVTAIDLPAYAESVVAGSNAFALSYTGKTITAPRTELGLRSDKSFALDGALLTLRGRAAWAHDFNADRSASATFQSLPGASFVVNGAAAARDAALTTASAELAWGNGFSLAATFEGEFSTTTRSYAGKGVARYAW